MFPASLSLRAGGAITLRVTPAMSFAPADVVVNAIIESNPDNRVIRVAAESADFYRASEMQLDGEQAPKTTAFEFRDLPGGFYIVTGTLFGSNGKARATVRQQVRVVTGSAWN
jgi:hypothetical protein